MRTWEANQKLHHVPRSIIISHFWKQRLSTCIIVFCSGLSKVLATFYLAEAHQDFMTCTSVDKQCSQERDTTNYATGRFSARSYWQGA